MVMSEMLLRQSQIAKLLDVDKGTVQYWRNKNLLVEKSNAPNRALISAKELADFLYYNPSYQTNIYKDSPDAYIQNIKEAIRLYIASRPQLYSKDMVMDAFDIAPDTLPTWIREGKITPVRGKPKAIRHVFTEQELERFTANHPRYKKRLCKYQKEMRINRGV